MKKKLLASLMALGLLVGMLTTAAMAVEGGDDGSVEATAVVTDEETPESIPEEGDSPSMTAVVPEEFTVGEATEFSFTTHGAYDGGNVNGYSNFSDTTPSRAKVTP